MNTSHSADVAVAVEKPRRPASPTGLRDGGRADLARRILAQALLLGIAADALLRHGPTGLGLPVWIALVALSAIALSRRARRRLPREAGVWLGVGLLFAVEMAWRDSEMLQFFDALAVAGALAFAGMALADIRTALFAERLRDTAAAFIALARQTMVGVIPLALRDATPASAPRMPGRTLATPARIVAIAAAVLVVFGSLLRSADPIFASLVQFPDIDGLVIASHVFLISFYTITMAGWARGALLSDHRLAAAPAPVYLRLGGADITAALGTLVVLFAAFVAAQVGWLFGGERFLRERTGLTVADYARRGFFQMMWVATLVVPLLVATRATLDPGAGPILRRRHARLSLPVIALLGLMITSAFLRMRLYVQYYGLTTDRLYPLAVMAWLALVLVWIAGTVLRDWSRPFAAGVVISGLTTLAALNVASPDAMAAKVNLHRAAQFRTRGARPLDLQYLAGLRGGAVALATEATLEPPGTVGSDDAQRCEASRLLLARWGPSSRAARSVDEQASWRSWNADAAAALRAVAANAKALRSVQHETCARARGHERSGAPVQR